MSSLKSKTRSYHHGDLRPALLNAVADLLRTTPSDRLSLREVARVAGVSHAAPYHYFPDRAAMLKAAGTDATRRLLEAQVQAADAETDPTARLVAIGLAYVRFAAEHPHAFNLAFDPRICPPGNPLPETAPLIACNETLLSDAVMAAQSAGGLPAGDPASLAAALWATVHGLAQLVMAGLLPIEAAEPALWSLAAPSHRTVLEASHAPG
jgi:AcrR family transcriptional regulator